jgi:glycosyltransferase involved in cell wall biosynthesis
MSTPPVSVLLPVHNGARTLQSSLESVLRQTFRDFELLAIDDGSTDESPVILRACGDPRLRVLRNETNIGLMRSLNRGLREARGALIARQDADDLSQSWRLQRQVDFLTAHPDVALAGSSCWRMSPDGRVTGSNDLPTTHTALRWASVLDNPFIHTSVVFRRSVVLDELGGYDESCAICEDYELWNRIAARHQVANLPERLVFYREQPNSMMQSQPEAATRAMRRLLAANLTAIFPGRVFADEEVDLLSQFRLRFPVEKLRPLLARIESLREEFLRLHPEAARSADFRAAVCREELRIAYKFLTDARTTALLHIARASARSPREWLRQGWTVLRCAAGAAPIPPA